MRRLVRYDLLVAALLMLACSYFLRIKGIAQPMPENSQYIRNLTMTSKFTAADFAPDGNLSKKVWQDAPRIRFDQDRFGHNHFPASEVQVASTWRWRSRFGSSRHWVRGRRIS